MGNGLVNIRTKITFAPDQNHMQKEVIREKGLNFYIKTGRLCCNDLSNPVYDLFRKFYIDVFSSKNCVFERMYGKNNKF
jgi:hypothetical protein